MSGRRDIHQVRTVDDAGNPHYVTWIESDCGTYYHIIEELNNFSSQAVQEAKWDLKRGRMTPDAISLAKFPLIFTNPTALLKGKNK